MMRHGTVSMYDKGRCRCEPCKEAKSKYRRRLRDGESTTDAVISHDALSDLLNELFPFGLTDDCPARRKQVA